MQNGRIVGNKLIFGFIKKTLLPSHPYRKNKPKWRANKKKEKEKSQEPKLKPIYAIHKKFYHSKPEMKIFYFSSALT